MFSCQQRDINQALIQDLAGAAEDTHTHTQERFRLSLTKSGCKSVL